MTTLPGQVPPSLTAAIGRLGGERREALLPHLLGGTSADFLADWMKRAGVPVSATTIKVYRRSLA